MRDQFSRLLMGAGRSAEAEAVVAGTLQKDPKDKAALLQRTTLEIDKGDLDGAGKDVKTLQEMKAFSAQLSYQEARIYGSGAKLSNRATSSPTRWAKSAALPGPAGFGRPVKGVGRPQNALALLIRPRPPKSKPPIRLLPQYGADRGRQAGGCAQERECRTGGVAISVIPLVSGRGAAVESARYRGGPQSLESAFQLAPANYATLKLLGAIMNEQKEGPAFLEKVRAAAAKIRIPRRCKTRWAFNC